MPKPPQKQGLPKQSQPQGQKRQGKQQGNQNGPKGKNKGPGQKQHAYDSTNTYTEPPQPPLPPPTDGQSNASTSVDADIPPPPSPPGEDSHTTDVHAAAAEQEHAPEASALPSPPGISQSDPEEALSGSGAQPRAQVGFKLAANKRQKLKVEPKEEPKSKAAHFAAMRQRLEQAVAKQDAEQQQMQQHSRQALQDKAQQAKRAEQPATAVPVEVDAHAELYLDSQQDPADKQSGWLSSSQQKSPSLHGNQRQFGTTASMPPGLQLPEQLAHQSQHAQQLQSQPQQAQESALPPDFESEAQQLPEQLQHQLPGPQPHEGSRSVHRRRSKRGRRTAPEVLLAGQGRPDHAPYHHSSSIPGVAASDFQHADHTHNPQQADLASGDLPQHPYSHHAGWQISQQPPGGRQLADQALQSDGQHSELSNHSSSPALADIAESGGAVGIANGSAVLSPHPAEQVQVLADDVKSLLR